MEEAKGVDPVAEADAMKKVAEALKDLPRESASRVARWALETFKEPAARKPILQPLGEFSGKGEAATEGKSLAEFFASASPTNGPEYALVVAYWLQVEQENEDLEGAAINKELKHLGHGVKNITDALSSLMERKPAFVIQTKKSGKSRQARKRYRVTEAGIARVKAMLVGEHQTNE